MMRRAFLVGAASASASTLLSERADAAPFSSERISITTEGSGPDILFIPGLASHSDVFMPTARNLAGKYRSHLVQVNGFAGSAAGANARGPVMEPVVAQIERYIREERLAQPALVGHSMGGTMAMMIAARHEVAIGRLMIVDTVPFVALVLLEDDRTFQANPTSEAARQRAEKFTLFGTMFYGMTDDVKTRGEILKWLGDSDKDLVARSFVEAVSKDLREELRRINIPVTVLHAPRPNMDSYYDKLGKQAHLVSVKDSKHFIMLDQPDQILREIETFMGSR